MAKLKELCSYCGLVKQEVSSVKWSDTENYVTYKCGHAEIVEIIDTTKGFNWVSVDGEKQLRDYQKTGAEHLLNANLNGICGDQMRLGKTPQALIAVREGNALPSLVCVKSANLYQWVTEIKIWASNSKLSVFIIDSKVMNWVPQGFDFYVISMDSLRVDGMVECIKSLNIKSIICDEAHSFKNTDSARSRALVTLLAECNIPHKLFLTGTPIKNRAEEFFVMLNLIAPAKFPSLDRFRKDWLVKDGKGKWSSINPYSLTRFKEEIAPFYIRREKEDVYTDLPPMDRIFTVIQVDDPRVKAIYNRQLDILEKRVDELAAEGKEISFRELQGNMMVLRRICGMAKVPFALDYLDIFLDETQESKLCIGIHHTDVRNYLTESLNKRTRVMELSGRDDAYEKNRIMRDFALPQNQLLIMNMLAGGVGMDFHYCHNVLVLERMWSSADEEQFEFRFYNPDRSIMGNHTTTIEYPIAAGTVDEDFYNLVEYKRRVVGETIGNHFDITQNPENFKELLQNTLSRRLK